MSYRTTLNVGEPSAADIMAAEAQYVLQTYKRLQVVFTRGKGSFLYSAAVSYTHLTLPTNREV